MQNLIGEVVEINSITGAIILEFQITQEKENLAVSRFQNGIYFLRVGGVTKKGIVAR
jgi:hypothetical protein